MSRKRPPAAPPAIPGFQFVSVLGSGGFSDVYLYEQDRPRRKVAVKVLTADLKTDGARRRFESEANLMAQLSTHPYIVTIYQADITAEGHSYLAMEYCSRPSLDVRSRRGKFSVDEALSVGIQVASAVETAHRAGIVHRDIKPANILVTDYNRPALTDFGISGTIDMEQDDDGGMSIPWSPPESFVQGTSDGVKIDIWALGATIYTLLAGHSPFVIPGGDNSQRELIARIGSAPLQKLARADVPDALHMVLATAMSKSPSSRYSSAKDLARALMRVQTDLNLSVTPFEVQDDLVAEEINPDENYEETRIRSVVSIDPDSQQSSPTFPSAFKSGSTTGLTRNGGTLPSGAPANSGQAASGLTGPATTSSPLRPGTPASSALTQGNSQSGATVTGSGFSNMVSPTEWADSVKANRPLAEPVLETTLHRSDLQREAPVQQVEKAPAPVQKSRTGLILGIISGAILVGAGITTAIILATSGAPEQDPIQTQSAKPTIVIEDIVPQVTGLTAKASNGGADWTWKNPDPQEGDFYIWAPVSAVDSGEFKKTNVPRTFVTNNASNESCIAVKLVRKSGKTSEEVRKCFK